jgi:hypothetical protein
MNQRNSTKGFRFVKGTFESIDGYPVAAGLCKYHQALGVLSDPEQGLETYYSFRADRCDCHLMAGSHLAHQGNDSGVWKVRERDFISGSGERVSSRHAHLVCFTEKRFSIAF